MDSRDFIQAVPLYSPTSFSLLAYPIVRTLKHSTEEHALELSLRLDVGLRPEPVLIIVSLDATIVFLEQRDMYKFTSWVIKH